MHEVVQIPEWMGAGRALTMKLDNFIALPKLQIDGERQSPQWGLKLIPHLPSYMYFYLPDFRVDGNLALLHGGEALPFVAPAPAEE